MLLVSIPSPSKGVIPIGPLQLHAYGLCIALGVVAAVWLADRRWVARGGRKGDVGAVATWAVPAGVIGARMYHVATDWKSFRGQWHTALYIWKGGLGIWGGVALGTVVGLAVARRRGLPAIVLMDCAAPAIPLAQAIGRWGNWFNQELFGRPTTAAWGLEISPSKRPAGYENFATFHPTFLYESLWNLLIVATVILVGRQRSWQLKPGRLFALYVAMYTFARFFIERLRIDKASLVGGLRINEWVSAIVFVIAVAVLVTGTDRRADDTSTDDPRTDDHSADDQSTPDDQRVANPAQ